MKAVWHHPAVDLQRFSDGGAPIPPADLPLISGNSLVLTAHAATILKVVLQENGELLPLKNDDEELYFFNSSPSIDALDPDRSEIVRFPTGGVMRVKQHVFIPAVIGDRLLFSVPETCRSSLYVTHEFVDLVRTSGLTGLDFDKIWDAAS